MNESTLRRVIREEMVKLEANRLPELMTVEETARILKVAEATLGNWRHKDTGPNYLKIKGLVRYDRASLAEYIRGVK